MGRFLAGVGSALLLVAAGMFLWKSVAGARDAMPPAPSAAAQAVMASSPLTDPPAASEKTREEKRFARYDKDRNGEVGREEYLAGRRKAFAKLDVNGDGRLTFDEWATKSLAKFTAADGDRSGVLTPAEFAATKMARKSGPRPCAGPGRSSDES